MVGFTTAPLGDAGEGAMDLDQLPSSVFERVNPLGTIEQIGQSIGAGIARTGTVDDYGNPITAPEPLVAKEVLNDKYRVDGPTPGTSLAFSQDMPDSVAQGMSQAKLEENARANAAQRAPAGIGSTLANLGYGFLDPVGLAASVLPVFGEVRIAALLGRAGLDLGEGLAGRTALRAATGAVDATTANAPLVGLRYGLSQQDGTDYSMYDAASDLAFGALLGTALHPLIGAARDFAFGRTQDAAAAQTQAATAAVLDDRPVQVAPIGDSEAAGAARDELLQYAARADQAPGSLAALDGSTPDAAPAPSDGVAAADRGAAINQARSELESLRGEADQFQSDVETKQAAATRGALDPDTAARLGEIESELSGAIPVRRRANLNAERTLLLEGADHTPDIDPSDAQELQGLTIGADRAQQAAVAAQSALDKLVADDAAARTAEAGVLGQSERQQSIQQAQLEARQAMVQNLTARTLRRYAGSVGATLEPGEADALASDVMRSSSDEHEAVVQNALDSIRKRGTRSPVAPEPTPSTASAAAPGLQRIQGAADAARAELQASPSARQAAGELPPDEDRLQRQAKEQSTKVQQASAIEPDLASQIANLEDTVQRADAAGALDPGSRAALRQSDAAQARSQGTAQALAQAAACLLRGL